MTRENNILLLKNSKLQSHVYSMIPILENIIFLCAQKKRLAEYHHVMNWGFGVCFGDLIHF